MRRILVDYARRHRAIKRSPGQEPVSLASLERSDAIFAHPSAKEIAQRADLLMAVDEALSQLVEIDPRLAQVVEYRFFVGLTEQETAELLGVTPRTVASGLGPGARLADATSALMNPEFERRLLELVDQALELPAEARAAFSPQGLRGDSALESRGRGPHRIVRQGGGGRSASWWTLPRCSRIRSFGRWRRKKKRRIRKNR